MTLNALSRLPPSPQLTWSNGALVSTEADDVYFSRDGGLEESRAVFLAGCGLPERWRGRARFAIGELGFGTGLNALATWELWRQTRPEGGLLHFVSIELRPLEQADAARALASFPDVAPLAERLLARWPIRAYGPQRLWFPDDGFCLTLHVGEAERVLATLSDPMDAWFLDGFAPSRNPTMWTNDVLAHVGRLSAGGARIGTYTVAGRVRTQLEAAGFGVEKRAGFGKKRERLEAVRAEASPAPFRLLRRDRPQSPPRRVLILGAGVAGAACAHAFARRGIESVLIDRDFELSGAASGAPAGLVVPRLDRGDTPPATLHRAAFLAAVALYREAPPGVFEPVGVLDARLAKDLLDNPPLPPDWMIHRRSGAALFPHAGFVRPRRAIAWLMEKAARVQGSVAAMRRTESGWAALGADGGVIAEGDVCVIAGGDHIAAFPETAFLPVERSRGQLEHGPCAGAVGPARSGAGYALPFDGGALFGATFDPLEGAEAPAPPDASSRARNLEGLRALAPAWRPDEARLESRVAVRATSPDRLPFAGLCPNAAAFESRFADLAFGRAPDLSAPAPAFEGLYLLGALGARGLTLAPSLGEAIAAEACGEPAPFDQATLDAIHPARFLVRALKRRRA